MSTIEFNAVSKRFGPVAALQDLTFTAEPGRVTGLLGANGAGKTTALRILLGLIRADGGSATIAGRRIADLDDPARTVGAVLDTAEAHPGRRAVDHLRILATAGGIEPARVPAVLDTVGLGSVARRRVGGFSLGMRARLSLAAALLGDPDVLILDEPTNGLDPAGIHWLRGTIRHLADEGRTVLVSSHLLAEVALTVDDVVIVDHGRVVRAGALESFDPGLEDLFLELTRVTEERICS